MKPHSFTSRPSLLLASFLILPHLSSAAIVTWSGLDGDDLFSNGGNWLGGNAPANNDYQDTARFEVSATPSTISLGGNRSLDTLDFQSAGWTITGNQFNNIDLINSAGAGTNTIASGINAFADRTWNVATGNTLHFTGVFYLRNKTINLTGGGVVELDNTMTGFGGASEFGLALSDITLVMNTTSTGSSNSFVSLDSLGAAFRIATSVANAESLASSNRIRDGLGNGLSFTDIGGGFTEVTAVPEPQSLLLTLGGGLLLGFRRRRG
ncbi:MAG: PEP-CTERM sorting domain-containing protein [Verrucomicrobiales bacterium]